MSTEQILAITAPLALVIGIFLVGLYINVNEHGWPEWGWPHPFETRRRLKNERFQIQCYHEQEMVALSEGTRTPAMMARANAVVGSTTWQ